MSYLNATAEWIDALSADELAVLELTSPSEADADTDQLVLLTSKEAYVWAVAISHILEANPGMDLEDFVALVHRTVESQGQWLSRRYRSGEMSLYDLRRPLLNAFLTEAGLPLGILDSVFERTAAAVQRLIDIDLIEDPFKKPVRSRKKQLTVFVAVLALVPVGFTQRTIEGQSVQTEITSMAWSYKTTFDGKTTERSFKIKVVEAVRAFQEHVIPAFELWVTAMSETTAE